MKEKNFLLSIDTKKIKYGLLRTRQLLEACNNPHQRIKSIQVVGTNGKGTTCAMLANVLKHNNYKVGLFTSPHLVDINERISVNFKKIPDTFIKFFINKYKDSIDNIKPSFFEIITVLSIYYFDYLRVDFAILETGLGGRLDSVTAARPHIVIFTSISYDHMSILGDTLELIAKEKIGAITDAAKMIYSIEQPNPVKKIFYNHVTKRGQKIQFISVKNPPTFKIKYLQGAHQKENAHLVAQVLRKMCAKNNIKLQQIEKYIGQTFWPGRLQYINISPDIIFDVAHNESGIQAFCKYLDSIYKNYTNKYLILGFEAGKEINLSIQTLSSYFDKITITETKIRNSMSAKKIKLLLSNLEQSPIEIQKNPKKAIECYVSTMQTNDLLVILGSHYFGPHINSIFKNCFDKPNKYS